MTQEATDILRNSLNRVERDRKRGTVLLFALLAMSVVFWLAMCFAPDDHKGLPFGLAAVMVSAYVAGMITARSSQENTRMILKAIDLLGREERNG